MVLSCVDIPTRPNDRTSKESALHLQVKLPRGRHFPRGNQIVNPGCLWLPEHSHARFVGGAVAFALVAFGTGTGGVTPTVAATPALGHDVIEGEVALGDDGVTLLFTGADAAVDTAVAIALEDPAAAPADAPFRGAYITAQAQNRGNGKVMGGGRDVDQFFRHRVNTLA